MEDSFFTINKPSRGLYKVKGSKFISLAFPVSNETEINSVLNSLHKEYHDARHHCYAWKIGFKGDRYRINDDGEPSGTAGKPILGQINAKQLTNILLVVIRYFGGILLGTGGLTHAYKNAASSALENAEIIEEYIYKTFYLTFDYSEINQVRKVLHECEGIVLKEEFKDNCKMNVNIREKFELKFIQLIERLNIAEFEEIV